MSASSQTSTSEPGSPRHPNTAHHFQGTLQEYDQENVTWEPSHGFLQHVSDDQNQHTMDGIGPSAVDDELPRPTSTALPGSPRFSILSYDSLEESPPHSIVDQSPTGSDAQPQHKSRYCAWLPTTIWSLEILSCVIASLCLAAIVGILSMYHGRPLPQWRYDITINALISVFTAIFKMALTMPVAEGM